MKRISLIVAMLIFMINSTCFGQLFALNNSNESATIVLAGAIATTNPVYSITTAGTPGLINSVGSTNGVTAVTLASGSTSSSQVTTVSNVSVYNADTAAVTVSIRKTVSGTSYVIVKQTIPPGSTLTWNAQAGVQVSAPSAVANAGAVAGTGVTVSEQGNGVVQKSVFTLNNATMTVADATVGVGTKIYDFPEGRILILGATGSATFTTTSILANTLNASSSSRWGVGTVTQTNATLATTEQDILPVTTFTSSATIAVANTVTTSALAASAQFDGTGTAKDAYFNISVPTNTDIDADATVVVNGTVTITWVFLGDY